MTDPSRGETQPDETEQRRELDELRQDPLLCSLRIRIEGFTTGNDEQPEGSLPSFAALQNLITKDLQLKLNDTGKDDKEKDDIVILSQDVFLDEKTTLERVPTIVICRKDTLEIPDTIGSSLRTLGLDDGMTSTIVRYVPQQ